jgi:hypothetical protein
VASDAGGGTDLSDPDHDRLAWGMMMLMSWLLIYVQVWGGLFGTSADVQFVHVTEAQCRAFIEQMFKDKNSGQGAVCISPDGKMVRSNDKVGE